MASPDRHGAGRDQVKQWLAGQAAQAVIEPERRAWLRARADDRRT